MKRASSFLLLLMTLVVIHGCSRHKTNPSTPPPPINAPSNLTATAVSSTQINLSWTNNATNQTGFNVERSPDGVSFAVIASVSGTTTAYQDKAGPFPLATFFYRVQATNASTVSPFSNVASATTSNAVWTVLSPSPPLPTPRVSMASANALVSSQMVILSGDDGTFPPTNNETWTFQESGPPAWTLQSTPINPGVRLNAGMDYNPANQTIVLFGGYDGTNLLNDVWVASQSSGAWTWAPLSTAGTPPSGRLGHTVVIFGMKLYVFGGQDATNTLLNDVWVLDLSVATPTWTQLFPSGLLPDRRGFHTAIVDAANARMILFAGTDGTNLLNDTWSLSLSGTPGWTPLSPAGVPPSGRSGATAVYDSSAQRMIIFGGNLIASSANDVWMLSLSTQPIWKQLNPAGTLPATRGGHIAVFDDATNRMIIFGGQDSSSFTLYNDVWQLQF